MLEQYESSVTYSRRVGNLYTGSLYLGLISLLENSNSLQANQRIGLFSYGSGAVCELFSGLLVEGFETYLEKDAHLALLENRQPLSMADYETMFADDLDTAITASFDDLTPFSIQHIENTIRVYRE